MNTTIYKTPDIKILKFNIKQNLINIKYIVENIIKKTKLYIAILVNNFD